LHLLKTKKGRIVMGDKQIVEGLVIDLEYMAGWLADNILEKDMPIHWETLKELRTSIQNVSFVIDCITEEEQDLV
jgi:hypothetical protein